MLPLLGGNHRLPLYHTAIYYLWECESNIRINEFEIGYMINPSFNVNRSFRYQVEKCMKVTFGDITQPHIIIALSKITQVC